MANQKTALQIYNRIIELKEMKKNAVKLNGENKLLEDEISELTKQIETLKEKSVDLDEKLLDLYRDSETFYDEVKTEQVGDSANKEEYKNINVISSYVYGSQISIRYEDENYTNINYDFIEKNYITKEDIRKQATECALEVIIHENKFDEYVSKYISNRSMIRYNKNEINYYEDQLSKEKNKKISGLFIILNKRKQRKEMEKIQAKINMCKEKIDEKMFEQESIIKSIIKNNKSYIDKMVKKEIDLFKKIVAKNEEAKKLKIEIENEMKILHEKEAKINEEIKKHDNIQYLDREVENIKYILKMGVYVFKDSDLNALKAIVKDETLPKENREIAENIINGSKNLVNFM